MIVTEILDNVPVDDSIITIQRDEELLHSWPDPGPMKIWKEYDALGSIMLPMYHVKGPFQPPQGVFESEYIHIEYQKMEGRQPFYHRNTDVDEITYHAAGERSVLTELGTVEMKVGDMNLIPVGVAHDNYAHEDVHIIFYIPAGVIAATAPYRISEYRMPPFDGWKPKDSIEFITNHLSALGSDCSTFYTSEQLLLDNAEHITDRMSIVRASENSSESAGVEWLFKSKDIWIGSNTVEKSDGVTYTRHRMADEIQIQTKGKRTLVTQRGTLQVEPGDFLSIPLGCAFASISSESNTYLVVLTRYPAEAKKKMSKTAVQTTTQVLAQARSA